MNLHRSAKGRGPLAATVLLGTGALVVGTWALLQQAPTVHAAGLRGGSADLDGDGLADALELFIGTLPGEADSDSDGYWDSEELARGSVPTDMSSVPGNEPMAVKMAVFADNGGPLHPVFLIYIEDGSSPAEKDWRTGVRVDDNLIDVPTNFFTDSTNGNVTIINSPTPGALMMVVDAPINPNYVHRFGSLSFYTTLSEQNQVEVADAVNVISMSGVLVEYHLLNTDAGPGPIPPAGSQGASTTGVYTPLDDGAVPSNWIPGQICAQTVTISGVVNGVVTQEVINAMCEDGWDAYCDPACASTVGGTIQVLDPVSLIGG